MTTSAFTYGTLIFPEVFAAVTGRELAGEEAELADHARYRLRDRVYPTVVPEPGAAVSGRVYHGLDAAALEQLDRFEDELYERRVVGVVANGETRDAHVYVCAEAFRPLVLPEPWDPDAFWRQHGERYLERCRRFYRDASASARIMRST